MERKFSFKRIMAVPLAALTSLVVAVVMIILAGSVAAYAAPVAPNGGGVEGDPWLISSLENFQWIMAPTADIGGHLDLEARRAGHYLLTADIDTGYITNVASLIGGIGTTTAFLGVFDGGNHTITVNISTTTTHTALFRAIGSGGIVRNLNVTGYVTSTNTTGNSHVGGVVGQIYTGGTVQNVHSSVNVGSDGGAVGGIAGTNVGTIANSMTTGSVRGGVGTNGNVGGIAGNSTNRIENSAALNINVIRNDGVTVTTFGRVSGSTGGTRVGTISFAGTSGFAFSGAATLTGRNGLPRTWEALQTAAAFPEQLTQAPWVHTDGYLPGLGAAQAMPEHLTSASHVITFSAIGSGEISASVGGSNLASGETALTDDIVNFTATPQPGYSVTGWTISGGTLTSFEDAATRNATVRGTPMTVTVTFGIPAPPPSGQGSGTASDPWHITDLADFRWITSTAVTIPSVEARRAAYYLLTADIDTGDIIAGAGLIGDTGTGTAFIGTFDGGGHTITVNISTNAAHTGLFRSIGDGGIVRNLHVTGNVTSTSTATSSNVGGVAGQLFAGGTVQNVHSSVNVSSNGGNVGGIVGSTTGTIANSLSTGSVRGGVGTSGNVGGITGQLAGAGRISNSAALNISVTPNDGATATAFGRVSGNALGTRVGNISFADMSGFDFDGAEIATGRNGLPRSADELRTATYWPTDFFDDATPWEHNPDVWPHAFLGDIPDVTFVTFTGVTANGAANETTTTELTLNFSAPITANIPASAVTVSGGVSVTGISGTDNSRTVTITGNWAPGANVNVSVASPAGYAISGSPRSVLLHRAVPTQPGAAVTAPGGLSATPNSVTVGTPSTLATATGQPIEYAISTSGTEAPTTWAALPANGIFTNLNLETQYFIWARSAQTDTHLAGAPTVSAGITTGEPAPPHGSGTASDPWHITDLADFGWITSTAVTTPTLAQRRAGHYLVTADIDTGDITTSAALIGGFSLATAFTGTFDGGGHTITVNISSIVENIGLFRTIGDGGIVRNLNVTGNVTSTTTATSSNVGGLVGQIFAGGRVENVHSSVNVSSNGGNVGGIAGSNTGTIANSIATGSVRGGVGTTGNVGGIVGNLASEGRVENSAALNISVTPNDGATATAFGRVTGNAFGSRVGNISFGGMVGFAFDGAETATGRNGLPRSALALQTAAGFPEQLTQAPWVHTDGFLPGLGAAQAMPAHLTHAARVITFSAIGSGEISASMGGNNLESDATAFPGGIVNFTATPNHGYRIAEWTITGGTLSGGATAANRNAIVGGSDMNVTVTFEALTTHAVTFSSIGGGNLTAVANGNPVTSGEILVIDTDISFTATPNTGYRIAEWTITGGNLSGTATATTRNATVGASDMTVTVTFEALPTHTVTFSAGANGNLTAVAHGNPVTSGEELARGTDISFTATPNTGYALAGWTITGGNLSGTATATTRNVTVGSSDITVTVTFEAPRAWSATVNGVGELAAASGSASPGAYVTLTLKNPGHNLTAISLTGATATGHSLANRTITFAMPAGTGNLNVTVNTTWNLTPLTRLYWNDGLVAAVNNAMSESGNYLITISGGSITQAQVLTIPAHALVRVEGAGTGVTRTINVGAGAVVNWYATNISGAADALTVGGTGTFNLNGGTLSTTNVTADARPFATATAAGNPIVNINGGTLTPSGASQNVLFVGNGTVNLNVDFTNTGRIVIFPADGFGTLHIPAGITLTNNGRIDVAFGSSARTHITGEGTINNYGATAPIAAELNIAPSIVIAGEPQPFVAVTSVSGVNTTAMQPGQTRNLTGTAQPANATNRTITWSIHNAGTTGATISGNTLNVPNPGTVTIRATVQNGLTETTPFTQNFTITVAAAAPATIINIALTGAPPATTISGEGNAWTVTLPAGSTFSSLTNAMLNITTHPSAATPQITGEGATRTITIPAGGTAPNNWLAMVTPVVVTVQIIDPQQQIPITFNLSQGGAFTTSSSALGFNVTYGSKIGTLPAMPTEAVPCGITKEDHRFTGWVAYVNGVSTPITADFIVTEPMKLTATWRPTPTNFSIGSTTSNNRVTSADATRIARWLIRPEATDFCILAADIDGDGEVTQADIILLARWLVGHNVRHLIVKP